MTNQIHEDGPPARHWRPHWLTDAPKSCPQTNGTVPQPNQNFKSPRQTRFASTACPGVCGISDESPKRLGPLPRLARPNSRFITHDNQNTSHKPPVAQLTKRSRCADARTFHRRSPTNHQFGKHMTRGGGWVLDVRKSALRLDFEPA
jgi:hypothetical protein